MAYQFDNQTGVIVADESATLSDVQQEYRDVFGATLDVRQTSPQGKLIGAETLARNGVAQNNTSVANQINPSLSEGVFLDALAALLGVIRQGAQHSTFSVAPTVTGVSGTVIPAGARASTANGDLFETTTTVTIGATNSAQVQFRSVETGAISAPINSLTNIETAILGWETVDNSAAATLGRPQESDLSLRTRRQESVGGNARVGPAAVIAALRAVNGVRSITFRQNIRPVTASIDGISIPANTVYAVVDGGTDADIGQALLSKIAGSDYLGDVEQSVVEPVSGQTYTVRHDRPDPVGVEIMVDAQVPTSVVSPVDTIRQSILDYAAGLIVPDPGFILGADVSPFEISAAINRRNPEITIRRVEVGPKDGVTSTNTFPIAINQQATILETDITVNIIL